MIGAVVPPSPLFFVQSLHNRDFEGGLRNRDGPERCKVLKGKR